MDRTLTFGLALVLILGMAPRASAHCDTLSGPVVAAGRTALQSGDVTPVLKWVRPADESEIRDAFRQAMAVRGLNVAARDLADRFFFETAVRLHRASEGEPYTGLKEEPPTPAIARADQALAAGDVNAVAAHVAEHATAGLRERFARVRELERDANTSVEAGRRYVEAYVAFIGYVEAIEEAGGEHLR